MVKTRSLFPPLETRLKIARKRMLETSREAILKDG